MKKLILLLMLSILAFPLAQARTGFHYLEDSYSTNPADYIIFEDFETYLINGTYTNNSLMINNTQITDNTGWEGVTSDGTIAQAYNFTHYDADKWHLSMFASGDYHISAVNNQYLNDSVGLAVCVGYQMLGGIAEVDNGGYIVINNPTDWWNFVTTDCDDGYACYFDGVSFTSTNLIQTGLHTTCFYSNSSDSTLIMTYDGNDTGLRFDNDITTLNLRVRNSYLQQIGGLHITGIWAWNMDTYGMTPPTPPAAPVESIDLIIADVNDSVISSVEEKQIFRPYINWTTDGEVNTYGSCNGSGQNVSAHFRNTGGNQTLSDSDSLVSLQINEGTTNIIEDTLSLRVCRLNVATSVQMYVNGSLFHTIPSNIIPLCSAGYHSQINTTTLYNTDRALNFSVKCADCDGIQRQITLTTNTDDEYIIYERKFTNHTEDFSYNSTSARWEHGEYFYLWDTPGTYTASVRCNDTYQDFSFTITDRTPTIKVLSINNDTYYTGIAVESTPVTEIITDINSDEIITIDFNVTYSNGTLIRQNNTEFMKLTSDDLNVDDLYEIYIYALDNDGNSTSYNGTFQINDTTIPMITALSPSADNLSEYDNNGILNVSMLFEDTNLYFYWFNITEKGSSVVLDNISGEISPPSYSFNRLVNTQNFTNNTYYVLRFKVADAHTLQDITPILDNTQITKNSNALTYQFGATWIKVLGVTGYEERTDFKQLTDRLTAEFYYSDSTNTKTFYVTSNKDIEFIPYDKYGYKGHFIIDKTYWLDFETMDKSDVVVIYEPEFSRYEVTISSKGDRIMFNSIGIINTETLDLEVYLKQAGVGNYNINIIESSEWFNLSILDFTSTAGVLTFFFLIVIWFFFIILSEMTQIPALALLSGLMGIFYGFLFFVSLSVIVGVFTLIISILYIIRSILMAR